MISILEGVERLRTAALAAQTPPSGKRPDAVNDAPVDRRGLEAALRAVVRGEVRFDDGSRALYSTDASNYRQVPIGVVIPRDADDVIATVAASRKFGAPVLSRGGGTSLAGQCCNVAVVMDMSKYMNRVLEIDVHEKRARVQPGCVLDVLRREANRYGLTYGPDPATHDHNTLGGMIGNNSCGMHAQMAGKVEENVLELDVLLYDGTRLRVGPTSEEELEAILAVGGRRAELYRGMRALRDKYAEDIRDRFPPIPRRVSGYNLNELLPENGFNVARALVGSESTLVTVLEATVRLIPNPECRVLCVLGFPDIYAAADHVPLVNEHQPIALEGIDQKLVDDMNVRGMEQHDLKELPDGHGWLMVEFGADSREDAEAQARRLTDAMSKLEHPPSVKVVTQPYEEHELWNVREAGLGATAKLPHHAETWEGWEDSAVAPDALGAYLRDLRALYEKYGYDSPLYGHFGQGCIHCRVNFDLQSAEGIAHWRKFMTEAAEMIRRYGGSLSGEHGDGQSKAEFLPVMFGETIVEAFRDFKTLWDPDGKMNPHKIVDPYPIDVNLRIGAHYRPWDPRTHFAYTTDHHSFAYAANRCVGVGKCRRPDSGTMCPSYQATREEKHSTRGRARLLFEMLEGDPLRGGWHDESVKEALDLCLACKGCKGECPVNVDMATYKAEFLSHYYEGRRRPIAAYAFGLIPYWAHLASYAPGLVNAVTQAPVVGELAKLVAGVAPQRRIPRFAPQSFKAWYRARGTRNPGGPPVMLWPDTFNNYFHPQTAAAAVEVLEATGARVVVPEAHLCCGRPLYDYGMLDLAKLFLREILDALHASIEEGIPLVGLEPSCVSVFRDEMRELLPGDRDAGRLRDNTLLLSEYLERVGYAPSKLQRKAVVHAHCHHKSVLGVDAERLLLEKTGLDFELLESGCCGMAGAFGFERGEHYEVSIKCGERTLLPAVREADAETLIVADGFSCREQIAQTTERRALHLADVLKIALREGPAGPPGSRPERAYVASDEPPGVDGVVGKAVAGAAVVAAGYALGRLVRRGGS